MGKEKTEQKLDVSDQIAGFMQKHRKPLLILLVLIAAGVAGSSAFFLIRGVLEKKAIAAVEEFERRKSEIESSGEAAKSEKETALLEEINAFAPSTFGYAAARSYSLAADIYYSRSEWGKAEEAWVAAARKAPKIYLAPVSLFNAAAAAEEQGKLEESIDYYRRSLTFAGIYPAAARTRFNIGRICETRNDKTGAVESYRELIEKNPDSNWAKLAQSRLIFLESK